MISLSKNIYVEKYLDIKIDLFPIDIKSSYLNVKVITVNKIMI